LTRSSLLDQLKHYDTQYSEELVFVDQFLTLLQHPDAYQRHHLPGHITGSSWIVDPEHQAALLLHHGKLNKWLQPGGHSDGDENTLAVALREAQEETGVFNFRIPSETIFDLDIHPIPERKDMPAHFHYDVRFLFYASVKDTIIVSEESHDVMWIPFGELHFQTGNNSSILRMLEKTERGIY
jgi:8-oxo-dGTP pyrophosphatase MutT (NUDIX family)